MPRRAREPVYYPILTEIEKGIVDGLEDAGRIVLKRSNELAPVDDGGLRKSGRVITEDLTVTVKYTAPHAWLQHERLDYQHPNGGQAKFLETAALETDLATPVARRVRAVLGG